MSTLHCTPGYQNFWTDPLSSCGRQHKPEGTTLPCPGAVHADLTAEFFDNTLDNGQPQAVAFGPVLVEAREGREELRLFLRRKAGAVVANEETVSCDDCVVGLILGVAYAKLYPRRDATLRIPSVFERVADVAAIPVLSVN